ncbi:DUF418 domain-containing protein [Allonocardiopsis opalescens]|uniref:Putative membrane protein YeiB n=1 Tax=Allonocardiopsis opalescens TaxID=1144618 RepID=A0A2T0PU25_9ACTN|nr:DUF418 domain-containing protein [Allonocardiopsis opalescens]PRX92401.1 putative membrane protein YeiB [Allonocardiopsis opalescens]
MTQTGEPAARAVRRGAVRPGERVLAPDLARGAMLLLIVLSNTTFYLWAARYGPSGWHPVDGSALDRAVQFAMIVGLDLRVYPLFAFLFGYGMMQLFLRQTAAGTSERAAAALLRRRSLWLLVFGFAHAALLMAGDILGVYGLLSLLLGALFLRRAERTVLVWAAVGAALMLVLLASTVLWLLSGSLPAGGGAAEPSFALYGADESDPLAAAATRLSTWASLLVTAPLGITFEVAMLLGFWAARRRVLEETHRHLRLLWGVAVAGIALGWLGGLPAALAHVGVFSVPAAALGDFGPIFLIQSYTGLPGGLGYVAAFALVAHYLPSRLRSTVPVVAVAAVGRRSLSSYLAHSLLFSPVLAAWGLGLGAALSSATMALYAVAVWAATAAAAYAMERTGRRGPAEVLLRRLVYRDAERSAAPAGPGAESRPG